jgi:hypothetical protein
MWVKQDVRENYTLFIWGFGQDFRKLTQNTGNPQTEKS